ncbi:MAG: FeoB-associated Cys-rich membrane protein [Clostridia bacterium]|nr:FeoB-associated Cys-rich membrane protein [Clostridia bacterium]
MNLPTIITATVIFGIVAAIIIVGIRNRKKGKSSCGCGCSGCALSGTCHSKK